MQGGGVHMHSVGSAFIGTDVDKLGLVLKQLLWAANDAVPTETPTGEVCSVHLAAVGDVLLYGTVFDCLQLIELEEIYHFQGHTRADMVQSLDFFTFLVVKHVCDLKDLCGGRNDRLFSKFEVGIEKCVTCQSVLNFL